MKNVRVLLFQVSEFWVSGFVSLTVERWQRGGKKIAPKEESIAVVARYEGSGWKEAME